MRDKNDRPLFSVYTLGCKVNQYDTNAMTELLAENGFEQVRWGEEADICIVNTCTVTNTADSKSRNMIRRAVKQSPDAAVIVCGCLAQSDAEQLMGEEGVAAVVGTEDRKNIAAVALAVLEGGRRNAVVEIADVFEPAIVRTGNERTRGYIKIQEGCNNFCSYCIIPYVRGRVRSRVGEDALAEAAAMAAGGIKEIVLTGIHLSSYGADSGERLLDLIGGINGIEGIERIRLGSLEPGILTEGFLAELREMQKVCPHFHVSLQSGSDKVLQLMRRRYTAEEYAEHVALVRRHYADPAVTTDIITGFPGEGEREFEETVSFVKKIGFSRIHVFPFSERKGTVAEKMQEGRVAVAVRKERARQLIEIGKGLEQSYASGFIGKKANVLFEQQAGGYMEGYTDRYLRVRAKDAAEGEVADVWLETYSNGILYGHKA